MHFKSVVKTDKNFEYIKSYDSSIIQKNFTFIVLYILLTITDFTSA